MVFRVDIVETSSPSTTTLWNRRGYCGNVVEAYGVEFELVSCRIVEHVQFRPGHHKYRTTTPQDELEVRFVAWGSRVFM